MRHQTATPSPFPKIKVSDKKSEASDPPCKKAKNTSISKNELLPKRNKNKRTQQQAKKMKPTVKKKVQDQQAAHRRKQLAKRKKKKVEKKQVRSRWKRFLSN